MTDERDPALQSLFAEARQDLPADVFTAGVMSEIDRLKRRAIVIRLIVALIVGKSVV